MAKKVRKLLEDIEQSCSPITLVKTQVKTQVLDVVWPMAKISNQIGHSNSRIKGSNETIVGA